MEKNRTPGYVKNVFILFLVLTIFLGIVYYIYQDRVDTTLAEITYPSNAFYDFENDTIGEHPAGWSGWDWDGTEVIVWEKDTIHGQVAEIKNRVNDGVETATRFKKAESGIIEFDIYIYYDERVSIDITQLTEEHDTADDIVIHLGGSDSDIDIKDGDDNFVKVSSFFPKLWYHFKIEFSMEYWELWIDGEQVLLYNKPYIDYHEQPSYLCQLYFSTYIDDNCFYVDNVEITVINAF